MRLSLIVAALFAVPAAVVACSGIVVVKNGRVLVGANNDYSYSSQVKLQVSPNRDGFLGRICISMDTVPGWVPTAMKCMNESGFAITHAVVPRTVTPFDADKPQFRHNFLDKIAAECENVKQAIAMIQAYTLPREHGAYVHLMMADASGDSAIVEWVDGELRIIRRTGAVQFMTNHFLSKPETAGGPNSRYRRGSQMLVNVSDPLPAFITSVLKEVSVYAKMRGQEVGTLDSTVWDITERKLHLFYKRDFDHEMILNLDEELAKGGRTVPLDSLFPNPVPFETGWRDENGPVTLKSAR